MTKSVVRTVLSLVVIVSLSTGLAQVGPWNNPLKMAWSIDGRVFDPPATFQDSSGVPSAVRWKGDTLICAFQWFRRPIGSATWDRVAVKFSYDAGVHWTDPAPIAIASFPSDFQRPFDPTLALTTGDSIRIYFSSSRGTPPGQDSAINTYSAISGDGIHYRFEPGPRVDHPTRRVIDPAVIFFGGTWHYCSPIGAPQEGAYHYTSPNGLTFSPQATYPSDNTHNWTGNYLVQNDSEVRFYGSGPQLWYSWSPDGSSWSGYVNTNVQGGDPTVVRLSGTRYLLIFVGPPYQTGVALHDHEQSGMLVLFQNYPNPFNPSTTIELKLRMQSDFTVTIFDVLGRKMRMFDCQRVPAGTHTVEWDGRDDSGRQTPSGVYMCRVQAGQHTATQRMLRLQ